MYSVHNTVCTVVDNFNYLYIINSEAKQNIYFLTKSTFHEVHNSFLHLYLAIIMFIHTVFGHLSMCTKRSGSMVDRTSIKQQPEMKCKKNSSPLPPKNFSLKNSSRFMKRLGQFHPFCLFQTTLRTS